MSGKKDPLSGNTIIDGLFELDWWLLFQRVFGFLWGMITELYSGISRGTMPILICAVVGAAASFVVRFHWDYYCLKQFGIEWLYPKFLWNNSTYWFLSFFSGCLGWATYRVIYRIGMQNRARAVFEIAGLKTRTGQLPRLLDQVRDRDGLSRMRIARSGISEQEFVKAKGSLESAMGIYVSSIEEDRIHGTIDVTFSKSPIPEIVELEFQDIERLGPGEFFVGAGHTGLRKVSLSKCPHFLVAGETGSGKSTFLHQLITSLYRKDPRLELTLIDLKGGLEFTDFSDLPGITVVSDREEAARRLSSFPELIAKRLQTLKKSGAKSIEDLSEPAKIGRHTVVVDEAAEMFLSTEDNATKHVLSQIARQGRAIGIHLVIATQRPDTRALDPQIKANLTGVLCFKMLNDASSITVLGNGRATDLPAIPGRALWKFGPSLTEVQAPYPHDSWAKELLEEGAKARLQEKSTKSEPPGVDRFKPIH